MEFPHYLVEAVAEREEITPQEATARIATMTREERLEHYLAWNGILGYDGQILGVVDIPVLPDPLRQYSLSPSGHITNPGKFEGQPIYVPYFHDQLGDGMGEVISVLEDGEGLFQAQLPITDDDLVLFPDLEMYSHIIISEDGQGFVDHELVEAVE